MDGGLNVVGNIGVLGQRAGRRRAGSPDATGDGVRHEEDSSGVRGVAKACIRAHRSPSHAIIYSAALQALCVAGVPAPLAMIVGRNWPGDMDYYCLSA